jgi:glycerol kinase
MSKYILSIDQGTTSSRAILFTLKGKVVASAQEEFKQHFPDNGWVEHNPKDILHTVINTCQRVLSENDIQATDVCAIGIANQRETTIVWDKNTGEPIYNAIVWQDSRTSEYCKSIASTETQKLILDKTGLLLDSYFSASKIRWMLEHVEGARAKAEQGVLLFGTVDTFLLWHLTGKNKHRTDATNASRTLLFNIHQQCWDEALLEIFSIPAKMLPEVMDSSDNFGLTSKHFFDKEIPILAMAGDQQAALFGQACFKAGMAKCTFGTGAFLMLNTGIKALQSKNKLITTVAYRLNGEVTYAIEGSIFMAGATIQWLRDGLSLIKHAHESEAIAENTAINHSVYLVPAFTGLGAPYWDASARGAIIGLTRNSGREEIVSAGLQSVAFQTKDLQQAMASDGLSAQLLRVDGGMAENGWLMQFLANTLQTDIERPDIIETTALGVAYLAMLQAGIYSSLDELSALWRCEKHIDVQMAKEQSDELYKGWLAAVAKVRH